MARVRQRVQRHGVPLRAGNVEVRSGSARRHDEVVVRDLHAAVENDDVTRPVNPINAGVAKMDVLRVTKDGAYRVGHVRGLETGRRYLVEQRQERVKVVAIDDRDANVFVGELSPRRHSSESAAHNDDVG